MSDREQCPKCGKYSFSHEGGGNWRCHARDCDYYEYRHIPTTEERLAELEEMVETLLASVSEINSRLTEVERKLTEAK